MQLVSIYLFVIPAVAILYLFLFIFQPLGLLAPKTFFEYLKLWHLFLDQVTGQTCKVFGIFLFW